MAIMDHDRDDDDDADYGDEFGDAGFGDDDGMTARAYPGFD